MIGDTSAPACKSIAFAKLIPCRTGIPVDRIIAPVFFAGRRIDRDNDVAGCTGIKGLVDLNWRRFQLIRNVRLEAPDLFKFADIFRRDLSQLRKPRAFIGLAISDPVITFDGLSRHRPFELDNRRFLKGGNDQQQRGQTAGTGNKYAATSTFHMRTIPECKEP